MSELTREFARESECRWRDVEPAADRVFRRRAVKGGVDLNGGKIAGIKLEPVRIRKIGRIECTAPIVEGPGARADADFLLIGEIQRKSEANRN